MEQISVTTAPGQFSGQQLLVRNSGGQIFRVTIPAGVPPGGKFLIQLPSSQRRAGTTQAAAAAVHDVCISRQSILARTVTEMVQETSSEKLWQQLVDISLLGLHCDCADLFLMMPDNDGHPMESQLRHYKAPSGHHNTTSPENLSSLPSLVKSVFLTGMTVNTARDDCEFQTDDGTVSQLCMAMRTEAGQVCAALLAKKQKPSPMRDQFDRSDEDFMTMLLAIVQKKMAADNYWSFKATRNKCKFKSWLALVDTYLNVTTYEDDVQKFIASLLLRGKDVFECGRIALYAVDWPNNQLIGYELKGSEELVKRSSPLRSLKGVVAQTGNMINVDDAWTDSRYDRDRDLEEDYRTRSLLIAPLTSRDRVVAVLECANKLMGRTFSKGDEQELSTLGTLFADLIERILLPYNFANVIARQDHVDEDLKDMLKGYFGSETSPVTPASLAKPPRLCRSKTMEVQCLVQSLLQWDFDHWSWETKDAGVYATYLSACVETLSLAEGLDFSFTDSLQAIKNLQARYSTAAYHNWDHAFSVFHLTFVMLQDACSDLLEPHDKLALLLAALGHDVEHQGFNNQFLINSRDALAVRYNDRSVLENHHASVTISCLESLLAHASLDESVRFRRVIVASILGTDMANHKQTVEWLTKPPVQMRELQSQKTLLEAEISLELCSAVLHSADLAHPTLPWSIHKKLSIHCAEEFFMQYNQEQKLGLPSLPFMGKDPADLVALAPSQVGFIKFVVLPMWKTIAFTFDGDVFEEAVNTVGENLDRWQQISQTAESQ